VKPVSTPQGMPLLRLGFRPFYLAAALFASLAVPLWLATYFGQIDWTAALPPLYWHAHEMLFGFVCAVIIGFLLTAGSNWTGLATPRGPALAALALLWLAGRLSAMLAPYSVFAWLDVLLIPLVALVLLVLLLRARNTRNLPIIGILLLLALSNVLFHLAQSKLIALAPMSALHAALALVVMLECVMAGRVVPWFTMGATPGLKIIADMRFEIATLAATAVSLLLWVVDISKPLTCVALACAAALHVHRQWAWHPLKTRKRPILWILHAAYAWIAAGLALLALAQLDWVPVSAGIHALAVGATGGLIIGMITRTARGHTGRSLAVGRMEVAAYALVMLAAVLRVVLPLLAPAYTAPALLGAAVAWSAAFALYLIVYLPWLTQARLDGREG
jgi:uncharacterized protein involved in response to NO